METNLHSGEQRDVARAHGCQEGLLTIIQPFDGTGLPTMTHGLFGRIDHLKFRGRELLRAIP